jgi:hypothetical protein
MQNACDFDWYIIHGLLFRSLKEERQLRLGTSVAAATFAHRQNWARCTAASGQLMGRGRKRGGIAKPASAKQRPSSGVNDLSEHVECSENNLEKAVSPSLKHVLLSAHISSKSCLTSFPCSWREPFGFGSSPMPPSHAGAFHLPLALTSKTRSLYRGDHVTVGSHTRAVAAAAAGQPANGHRQHTAIAACAVEDAATAPQCDGGTVDLGENSVALGQPAKLERGGRWKDLFVPKEDKAPLKPACTSNLASTVFLSVLTSCFQTRKYLGSPSRSTSSLYSTDDCEKVAQAPQCRTLTSFVLAPISPRACDGLLVLVFPCDSYVESSLGSHHVGWPP